MAESSITRTIKTFSFKKFYLVFLFFLAGFLLFGCSEKDKYHNLKLNKIQVIGSHNSYKIAIESGLMKMIYEKDSLSAEALQYEHLSLTEQLNLGLRNLEVDFLYDPDGGRYAHPYGLELLKESGETPEPYDLNHELEKPGLKVFHIPDLDFRSHNLLFKGLLREIKQWSDSNSGHLPVIITVNAKDQGLFFSKSTKPLQFTRGAFDSVDAEIRSVLPDDKLITPDMVKGNYPSLENAVLNNAWPLLDSVKGRFLFVLDETGEKQNNYVNEDGSLDGRVMFVNAMEGTPNAAVRIVNDPVKDQEYIQKLVKEGYLVRTRADADTREARENNYKRFEMAKSSGAQVITTDYYKKSGLFHSDYKIAFDDGTYERINPISGRDK